jgi:hypothetical protein
MRALGLGGADLAELSAEVLGRDGSFRFRAHVHGSCMAPVIRDGDLLTVQPTEAAALRPGDVALYRAAGGHLFAHRVVGRRVDNGRLMLTACSDAAPGSEDQVLAEQVLGRVVRVQRGARMLDLERGTWRLAARLWVATLPLGPWLMAWTGRVKGLSARLLHWLRTQISTDQHS